MKSACYIDLDGVLADWLKAFNDANICSISEFNKLSKLEKFAIKEELFTYDFFRNMRLINAGKKLFEKCVNDFTYDGETHVYILSAIGDSRNITDIAKAKTEWVREHICKDVRILFVDKVQNKYKAIQTKDVTDYVNHILYDDRAQAIKSWDEKGGNMIGILTDHNYVD